MYSGAGSRSGPHLNLPPLTSHWNYLAQSVPCTWLRWVLHPLRLWSGDRHATLRPERGQGRAKDCGPVSFGCRENASRAAVCHGLSVHARTPRQVMNRFINEAERRDGASARGYVLDCAAEAPVAACVHLDRPPEVATIDIGPQGVGEDELRIGRLPQQEVARSLLSAGPPEQVDIRDLRLVEEVAEALLGDP